MIDEEHLSQEEDQVNSPRFDISSKFKKTVAIKERDNDQSSNNSVNMDFIEMDKEASRIESLMKTERRMNQHIELKDLSENDFL